MSSERLLRVGIVGLEFGAEFIPIYQRHPNAEMYAICQRTESQLNDVGDKYGIEVRYTDYAKMLADPNIDVIHINTPLQLHAEYTPLGPSRRARPVTFLHARGATGSVRDW